MPARRSLLAALLTSTTTAFAFATPAAAPAAEVGGFGARPAPTRAARDQPVGAYFRLRVHVRHLLRRQAIVSNSTSRPVTLLVDAVDGVTGATSGSVYANRGIAPAETGRWVRPDVRRLTLAPHTSRRVTFSVRVPYGASPGNHLAGLAFQNAHAKRGRGRFAIRQVVRVVVGVEVTVPGRARYGLALPHLGLHALGGTAMPAVIVRTHNSGRRLCKPNLSVSVAGRDGARRTVHRRLDTVLPGDTINYPLPWPHQLRDGAYTVDALATGCGPRATQHAVVHLATGLHGTTSRPGVLLPTAPAAAADGSGTPWWLFALFAFAGAIAGTAISHVRRPRAVA